MNVCLEFGKFLLNYSNVVEEYWFDAQVNEYTTEELYETFKNLKLY